MKTTFLQNGRHLETQFDAQKQETKTQKKL